MSLMVDSLRGQLIQDVLVDSEVVYIMLTNGTQITIKGLVVVEPRSAQSSENPSIFVKQSGAESDHRA